MASHEEEYEEKKREPFQVTSTREESKEGHILKWFKIERSSDEPIPGFYVQFGPSPSDDTLLFAHGLEGRKEDVMNLSEVAERFDLNMLAIDARRHGERKSDFLGHPALDLLRDLGRTIVDNRLAIDAASQKGWAQSGKILFIGSSMGAILGGVMSAVDTRITGAVLYVPGGDLVQIFTESKDPRVSQVRSGIPRFILRMFKSQVATIDPINYIDKISPRPLLIQLGKNDETVPFESGMKLFKKAREPKQLVVHDSGHDLPIERALAETIEWIDKYRVSLF